MHFKETPTWQNKLLLMIVKEKEKKSPVKKEEAIMIQQ